MSELRVDLLDAFSKPLTDEVVERPTWWHHGLRRFGSAAAEQAVPRSSNG
jgi:hypothetical protein